MKPSAPRRPGTDGLIFIASLVFRDDFLRQFILPHFVDKTDRILVFVQAQLKMRRCSNAKKPCDVNRDKQVKTISELYRFDLKSHGLPT